MFPLNAEKAGQKVPVLLLDLVGNPKTGITGPTTEITKNGAAAFASPNDGTFAEIGKGWYTVQLDATDSNDIGWLVLRVVQAANISEAIVECTVGIDPAEEVGISTRIRRIFTGRDRG